MPERADDAQPEGAAASERAVGPAADREEGVHPFGAASAPAAWPGGQTVANLRRMFDVPLNLTVELGSTEMPLAEVLRLDTGAVVTIDRLPGEPIDLLVNGRRFARGEVVVINDTFGYRITELVDDADELAGMPDPGGD